MMTNLPGSKLNIPDRKNLNTSIIRYAENDTEGEVSALVEYEDCLVVFDNMLKNRQKEFPSFFTPGRHENIDVIYLSRRHFEL